MGVVKGCLAVYVPAPDVDLYLTKGSGIVGLPLLEWWQRQGEDSRDTDRTYPEDSETDRVVIDFEGAIYGQVNMATWADRLLHAAGRHIQVYPTTARRVVHESLLVQERKVGMRRTTKSGRARGALLATAVAAAITFAGCQQSDDLLGNNCIVTVTGNELCGESAAAWCDTTDDLRRGDPAFGVPPDRESQAVCDDVRGR